ncbi:ATP-binding protein, partial [Acinetobacter baumannii]
HVLICGGTGSGKTVTCASILKQLRANKIPFLVLQPDKLEYRELLLNDENFQNDGVIYTVGNERVSPLHINPFQVLP